MTIYDSLGVAIYEAPINNDAIIKHVLMGDYYIELPFNVAEPLSFKRGCYIEYKGRKFEIMSEVHAEPNTDGGFKYTLRFEAQQNHLKRCRVFWNNGEAFETTFHNTTDIDSFGRLIVKNINAFLGNYNWSLGGVPADITEQTKLISFNGDSCWDAVNMIAETFDVEWWTENNGDKVSLYFGKLEFGTPEVFKAGDVVSAIPSKNGDTANYGTRFYVFGSTRNLPTSYNEIAQAGTTNHISETRLHLPNGQKYIDAWDNLRPEDVVEQVVFFDDVYPKNTDTVTRVSTVQREIIEGQNNTVYVITAGTTPFTPDDLLENETLGCTFTSGSLMGRSFELSINKDDFNKSFEIIAQTEGTDDNIIIIPNLYLHPEVGDTFILTGIKLPQARIEEAEQELLSVGKSWAVKNSRDTSVYDCPTNAVYCHNYDKNYAIGQKVKLVGEQFGEGRESRIQGYEKRLYDEYQATYTVGDNTAYSRFGTIEKNIKESAYAERIGVVKGVGIYIIRSKYDSTPPTDENVYSALATADIFLSKKDGGAVNAPVTFRKDVSFGGNISSEDFVDEGMLGRGFGVTKDENGNTVVSADILKIRKSAEFYELIINQMSFSRGTTVFSSAGCEIISVEEIGNIYRCYYDNKDGNRYSGFKVGDQARCQRFDANFNAIVKYYWRVVAGVGEDYIDLYVSGTDGNGYALAEGGGVPESGDEIVQMGSRVDATRQGVIVIASIPAPTILQYDGIDSFVLPAPSTKISPNDNEFTGRMHIEAGTTGAHNISDLPEALKESIETNAVELSVGKNLIRNSGFTGDYQPAEVNAVKQMTALTDVYSEAFKYWSTTNATAQASDFSQSGVEVVLANGAMSQTLKDSIVVGETYILSYYAKGTSITFSVGGVTQTRTLTLSNEYERYVLKFKAVKSNPDIQIKNANATICMLQLEKGNVPSEWGLSVYDNDKSLAYYQQLQYLASAIKDGSVDILGGLILANTLLLGNYQDGEMKKNTAGVSGIYNDADDVAFWAGGTMEQAITTVKRFKENPRYQPSDAEWAEMANFVATHGGDQFIKGYIFALGGYFRGTVSIANGKIQLNADGSGQLSNGALTWDKEGRLYKNFPDMIAWRSLHDYDIDYSKGGYYIAESHNEQPFTLPPPPVTPYRVVLKAADIVFSDNKDVTFITSGNFWYTAPEQPDKNEAEKTIIVGTRLVITTKNNASKGNVELTSNAGELWELFIPPTMVVGSADDEECDIKIY